MNTMNPNDPKTWPVAECQPTDIFLGETTFDYAPHLTAEQRTWPVADCVPSDVCLSPAIVLELKLSPNAIPEIIAQDTVELLLELNTREQQLGGTGFHYDKRDSAQPTRAGVVRLVLRPKLLANAKERLQQIAKELTSATTPATPSTVLSVPRTFGACEVVVLA